VRETIGNKFGVTLSLAPVGSLLAGLVAASCQSHPCAAFDAKRKTQGLAAITAYLATVTGRAACPKAALVAGR